MSEKDYYLILGISPRESQGGVKSAFRDLARQYHPDRAGVQSTRRFQEIAEAYRVLGDRIRRAAYDSSRAAAFERSGPSAPARPRAPVEPLDPGPSVTERLSVIEDFVASYPARDEVFDQFERNFTDAWLPKSERTEALNLVVQLTYEEAMRGASVQLGVPVFSPCPQCHGAGGVWLYACPQCRGAGKRMAQEYVTLRIPAMVADGAVFQLPLHALGVQNLYLQVMVRVGG